MKTCRRHTAPISWLDHTYSADKVVQTHIVESKNAFWNKLAMRAPIHEKLEISSDNTALLLVDIQDEMRSGLDYGVHEFDRVLSNTSKLLSVARSNEVQVVHAKYLRDFSVEPPREFEAINPDGSPTFSDVASDKTEICCEVFPNTDETVFTKNDASAFLGTGLNELLSNTKKEWLIICGVWTEACIAASVRDAIALGYRVLLVKDACGSGTKAMHETAVLNLANRLYGGGVCDTSRAVTLLNGAKADVWRIADPVPLLFEHDTISELFDQL